MNIGHNANAREMLPALEGRAISSVELVELRTGRIGRLDVPINAEVVHDFDRSLDAPG